MSLQYIHSIETTIYNEYKVYIYMYVSVYSMHRMYLHTYAVTLPTFHTKIIMHNIFV